MRFLGIVAAIAVPAFASSSAEYGHVWGAYKIELAKQCGANHLEWLAPAELRDALDDYKRTASHALTTQMSRPEKRECRNVVAGASRSNIGDIEIAEQKHLVQQIAARVCGEYAPCREQSD